MRMTVDQEHHGSGSGSRTTNPDLVDSKYDVSENRRAWRLGGG